MKKSKRTDGRILQTVKKSPGLSLYQLSRRLRWSLGKVDGSVSRLVNARRLFVVVGDQNGRRQNQVFPNEYRPTVKISVPTDFLRVDNPTWLDSAFVYGLDNNTIGVAGKPLEDWKEVAKIFAKASIRRTKEHVTFTIPKDFVNFYQLERRFFTKAVSGNNILISVGAPIQETRPYPS
jgi:hypothetical protein